MGRARPGRPVGRPTGGCARGDGASRNWRARRVGASASPISARRRCCGTGRRASRCTAPSSGRTGGRLERASACGPRARGRAMRERTGLLLDPYFSATKLAWLLDHVDGARDRAERGELAFGTVDSWLVWNLTGGRADRGALHVTDVTNASRTLLFNVHAWTGTTTCSPSSASRDPLLPRVVSSSGIVGHTHSDLFARPIPIAGIAGDQHAAAFGQRCIRPGWRSARTGRAAFWSRTRATRSSRSDHELAVDRRVAAGRRNRPSMRSKAASSSPGRPCSGCATGWG